MTRFCYTREIKNRATQSIIFILNFIEEYAECKNRKNDAFDGRFARLKET